MRVKNFLVAIYTKVLIGGCIYKTIKLLNQFTGRINGLKKVCAYADFQTRLTVANGVVISKLSYLITLWGGSKQYLLNILQVQQLTAARLVCGFGSWKFSKRKLLDKVGYGYL